MVCMYNGRLVDAAIPRSAEATDKQPGIARRQTNYGHPAMRDWVREEFPRITPRFLLPYLTGDCLSRWSCIRNPCGWGTFQCQVELLVRGFS